MLGDIMFASILQVDITFDHSDIYYMGRGITHSSYQQLSITDTVQR